MEKARKLKLWNGRGCGKKYNGHIYVAAYSVKHAVEIINKAVFGEGSTMVTPHEIRTYYAPDCWGNAMDGIVPTEPCVYASERYLDKPILIYQLK
jgi:hypothetical protein